jgi:hypothetical protein
MRISGKSKARATVGTILLLHSSCYLLNSYLCTDTLGGPKARPNDNGRALVATAPLPTSRNGTWATNILTIPDGLITLKEITTLQATLTEDLRSFNEFWSDQENVLALVSSQQLVMTMAEARNYIKGWEDAGIASRDATKTIKLAYDAYPTQSKG